MSDSDDDIFSHGPIHTDAVHHPQVNTTAVDSHSAPLLFPQAVNHTTLLDDTDHHNDINEGLDDPVEAPLSLVQQALTSFPTRGDFDTFCAAQYGVQTRKQLCDRIRKWAKYSTNRQWLVKERTRRLRSLQLQGKQQVDWTKAFVYQRYREHMLRIASASEDLISPVPPLPGLSDEMDAALADENVNPALPPLSIAPVSRERQQRTSRQPSRQPSTPLRHLQSNGPSPSVLFSPSRKFNVLLLVYCDLTSTLCLLLYRRLHLL